MITDNATNFDRYWHRAADLLATSNPVSVGQWQSQSTEQPMLEILNASLEMDFHPESVRDLQLQVTPNLPWAEDHFLERVSGEPLNPPPSESWWPFAQEGNAAHKSEGEKFSHTYPERMWPKLAGGDAFPVPSILRGVRFDYGDLMDVVKMLQKTPMTRQAYLPIWFPEDTGAVHGKRVPCSLGYHFQLRNQTIYVTYYIRSCDIVRHMRDDVYMAARLGQWVASHLTDLKIEKGVLTMHMANMHCFAGDRAMLQYKVNEYKKNQTSRMLGAL